MTTNMFTGTVRIKVCEATGLRPTDFQRRHNMTFGKPDEQLIDPYVSIDVDENHLGKFQVEFLKIFSRLLVAIELSITNAIVFCVMQKRLKQMISFNENGILTGKRQCFNTLRVDFHAHMYSYQYTCIMYIYIYLHKHPPHHIQSFY